MLGTVMPSLFFSVFSVLHAYNKGFINIHILSVIGL